MFQADSAHLYDLYFRPLNKEFKEICYKWQMTPLGSINDHSDREYDVNILDSLDKLHWRLEEIFSEFGNRWPQSLQYVEKLRMAKQKIDEGNFKAFTGVGNDSYHEIWMALHEFLLKAMGKTKRENDEV